MDSLELASRDEFVDAAAADAEQGIEEFLTGVRPATSVNRVLATVVFTDIVGSTAQAANLGDHVWKERLDQYDDMTQRQVGRSAARS